MSALGTTNKYDDIISLPHHTSMSRQPMSRMNRAAQFAPFAALTGFEDCTDEAARLTSEKPELTEMMQNELNEKLHIIMERINERPEVTVTYFIPDALKEGGAITLYSGAVRRIDEVERKMIFTDRTELWLDNILNIGEVR
ncbi:MAG: hypothetical protein ACI4JK_04150 [Oscillospiraceae bacterium]